MARVKTEGRRQEILRVAAETFCQLGVDGASMSEIAARLGGSKTTLYAYFSSKEELFMEVLLGWAKIHGEAAFQALVASDDIRTGLTEYGVRHLKFITSPQAIAMLRLAIAEGNRSDLGRQFYTRAPGVFLDRMTGFLQPLIEQGALRDGGARVMALQLKALFTAELLERQLLGDLVEIRDEDLPGTAARAVDVFLAAYAAPH